MNGRKAAAAGSVLPSIAGSALQRIRGSLLLAALALIASSLGGCITKSTHTEGDREVNSQTAGAAAVARQAMEEVRKGLPEGSPGWTLLGVGIRAAIDIQENAQQQEGVHGAPETPSTYSPDAAKKARERSTKEHESGGFGGTMLAVGGALAGILASLAGMPWLASKFPALAGAVGKAAEVGRRVVAFGRERFEEIGMPEAAQELLKISNVENRDAGIQTFQKKKADALEEKLGLDLKVKMDEPIPVPAPAPAPAAAQTEAAP